MKKKAILFVLLLILYIIIQIGFRIFDKGHTVKYTIKNEQTFRVKEIYTHNVKNEIDNYYFEIEVNKTLYNFQTNKNLNRKSKVIKKIYYFKNLNYECILPVVGNNKYITDIICKKDNAYYYYNSIKNSDPELDKFASKYNVVKDDGELLNNDGNIFIYDNIMKNHSIVLDNYKGIYLINKKNSLKNIKIFTKDIYSKDVSTLMKKYYVIADYTKEYDFHEFKVINLENYSISKIISNKEISLNSYVQGIVDECIYIFDRTNKKQYKIDVNNKTVVQTGNEKNGIKVYNNGKFTNENVYKAVNKNILFDDYSTDNKFNNISYYKVDKVGNKLSGYYYVYEKVNNMYNVYRANVQNKKNLIYLFKTDNPNSVNYEKDFIYYNNSTFINYFNELTGVKKIAKYNDMEFNKKLKFYVYIK